MARSSPWLLGEAGFMCGWPLCEGRQGLCGCSLGICVQICLPSAYAWSPVDNDCM